MWALLNDSKHLQNQFFADFDDLAVLPRPRDFGDFHVHTCGIIYSCPVHLSVTGGSRNGLDHETQDAISLAVEL